MSDYLRASCFTLSGREGRGRCQERKQSSSGDGTLSGRSPTSLVGGLQVAGRSPGGERRNLRCYHRQVDRTTCNLERKSETHFRESLTCKFFKIWWHQKQWLQNTLLFDSEIFIPLWNQPPWWSVWGIQVNQTALGLQELPVPPEGKVWRQFSEEGHVLWPRDKKAQKGPLSSQMASWREAARNWRCALW